MKTFIIAAQTADGLIAKDPKEPSTNWTSGADKKIFVELTKKAGVIVMGLNTYNTIGKPLPKRLNVVYAPADTKPIEGVELTQKTPVELLKDLENRGFSEVAICGGTTIYTMFLEAGLVDEIYLTIEPKIFGAGLRILNKSVEKDLKLKDVIRLNEDVVMLQYTIVK